MTTFAAICKEVARSEELIARIPALSYNELLLLYNEKRRGLYYFDVVGELRYRQTVRYLELHLAEPLLFDSFVPFFLLGLGFPVDMAERYISGELLDCYEYANNVRLPTVNGLEPWAPGWLDELVLCMSNRLTVFQQRCILRDLRRPLRMITHIAAATCRVRFGDRFAYL